MYRYYLYHPDLKKPTLLKHAPVGWDAMDKEFTRDRATHGIFFGYTPKIKFIKDGKAIIHTLYELYGPEAEIVIIIKIRNVSSRKWETDYVGKLNLMTLTISTLYAECNIEQTGFVQKFKNRQDVKVNLQSLVDLDGNAITSFAAETKTVQLHSKTIKKAQHLARTEGAIIDGEHACCVGFWYVQTALDSVVDEIGEYIQYPDGFVNTKLEDAGAPGKYHLKVDAISAGVYSFDLKFRIKVTSFVNSVNAYDISVKLFLKHKNVRTGVLTTYTVNVLDATRPFADPFTYDSGFLDVVLAVNNLALDTGDEIYYYWQFSNSATTSPNYDQFIFDLAADNYFKATVLSTFPATNAPLVLKHEAIARVCQAILGVADPLRSDYYGRVDSEPNVYAADGDGSLRGITNGFQVRGFPIADKPVITSMKDLFESLHMIDGVGMGVETINGKEYVVLEPLSHFYQPVEVFQVDNVKDIEKSVDEDGYYNELEIGYKKWTVSGGRVNHLDEFNTKREYSLPITQVKSKMRMLSPYIAAGHLLETTRRDSYNVSSTKDNENDNEIFIIQLARNGAAYVTAKNEAFQTLTGMISPATVYNADLSPGRCLLRHGSRISSFLQKQKDKSLRLTVIDGNTEVVSKRTDEANTVTEDADVAIASLTRPLWLPEIYRFKAPLTVSQMAALTANPYGYISFSNTTQGHKKCYILSAKRDAKTRLISFTTIKANL